MNQLMPTPKLHCLQSSRELNIAEMVTWTWAKTSRHWDLIEQQIGWAYEQRNNHALAILEEYRLQLLTARWQKLDE